jgi:hypothetical protein
MTTEPALLVCLDLGGTFIYAINGGLTAVRAEQQEPGPSLSASADLIRKHRLPPSRQQSRIFAAVGDTPVDTAWL